jgi:DNA-binding CsgD family transcriptional regulator
MRFLKIEEVAQKWGISSRAVQILCKEGKIDGAQRFGRAWMIPESASRPIDRRTREGRVVSGENQPLPRQTPFLYMTDLYTTPGTADEAAMRLVDNHEAKVLFEAEVAYARGEIDKVYAIASYLLSKHSGFYAVISAGMLLAQCAIWRGDLELWRAAKMHISEAPAQSDVDRDILLLAICVVDIMLYNVTDFPDWFRVGCFEPLHRDSFPAARVYYAKYLYTIGYGVATGEYLLEGVEGLSLMRLLPNTFEPMISQATIDRSLVSEICLRMSCAAAYHNSGDDAQAGHHIDRAIALALPDKLYGLLAEYCRVMDSLLEQRLSAIDADAWNEVKALYRTYNEGWSRLSGAVRGRTLATTLSVKEREVAKLAAFGMSNAQIAEKLHMSVSVVKQSIRVVSEKTGMSRREFAKVL